MLRSASEVAKVVGKYPLSLVSKPQISALAPEEAAECARNNHAKKEEGKKTAVGSANERQIPNV